jgi:lysophospholipase L1-like esterase
MRSDSNPRRPIDGIPTYRKIVYSVVTIGLILGGLELICRWVFAVTPNARWGHHEHRVTELGFGRLNHILEPDTRLFWRVKPSVEAEALRGRIDNYSRPIAFTVSTDAHGHRRTPATPQARRTVLFLGDSCTFGIGVDDDEAFPALLGDRLPDTRTINAGVPGYSAFQGRLALEHATLEPSPDAVVVSFLFNDDERWDGLSDLEHAEALARQRMIRRFRLLTMMAELLPAATTGSVEERLDRPRLTDREYETELRRIIAICRERGSVPILVVWAMRWQMYDDEVLGKQRVMRRVAAEQGVPLIDLLPALRSRGAERLFADVVHLNEGGNVLVADLLEPFLADAIAEADAR